MPVLHNRISNDALKAKMLAESEPRTTISFYKYFHIADPKATRDALYQLFTALNVFGRVYLAHEGINAQISVPASNVETFRAQLYAFDPALEGLRLNIALDDDGKSFWVLRMKVRDRIVADGIDDPHFDASNVGEYLQAAEVNAMLDDPDALFIDMRNHYEYEVGHFGVITSYFFTSTFLGSYSPILGFSTFSFLSTKLYSIFFALLNLLKGT